MPRSVIVQPNRNKITETFLRRHAEGLAAPVVYMEGGGPAIEGQPVLSQAPASRLRRRVLKKVLRRRRDYDQTAGFIRAFRRLRAEVVLAEFGPTGVKVLDACAALDLPLVVHFHGCDASQRDLLARHRDGYRRIFRQAAAIVAVSRAMQRQLIKIGAPSEKVAYNPYGVESEKFHGADPMGAPPEFLCVGRLVEKKAPYLTLLAFRTVLEVIPDARLRMVGEGPLLPVCKDLAGALGIDHAVEFLGPQPHDVVQDNMRRARAFLQHSVTAADGDSEGTPVAILEAGMSGLPVVATRHAGICDVVRDGETGLLVGERDVSAMAEYILALARDPALASRLGASAARHIRRHFTMEHSIARLSLLLEAAAARKSVSPVVARIEDEWTTGTVEPFDDFETIDNTKLEESQVLSQ